MACIFVRGTGKKIGKEQTDILIDDAVSLCNKLCDEYKNLSDKEKIHTER